MKLRFPQHAVTLRAAFEQLQRIESGVSWMQLIGLLISIFLLSGCGREDIRVYRVAKENKENAPQAAQPNDSRQLPPGHPEVNREFPKLTWKLPSGWEEFPPEEMRAASFRAKGQNGRVADVSVVPLPGKAGGFLMNVNRWRNQVGLEPVTDDKLAGLVQPVDVGSQKGELYEFVGTAPQDDSKTNILAAILNRDGLTWFFKMTGHYAVVNEQKPAFLEFLKSIKFETPEVTQSPSPPETGSTQKSSSPTSSNEGKPRWNIPTGWREVPPASQFLVAKFLISGENKGQASVNISITGGSLEDNVNRWRTQQLSLGPLSKAEIEKQLQTLEVPGGKAMLIDMRGTDSRSQQKARLVGAIVTRSEGNWYYKLMGDEQIVDHEKNAFVEFVKTATYP
jgi:hypothetical protein